MSKDPRIADEIISFLSEEQTSDSEHIMQGRVLATVMFNDIVGSTRLQSELGDELWKTKIRKFEQICKDSIHNFDGIFIKGLGDGVLAVFWPCPSDPLRYRNKRGRQKIRHQASHRPSCWRNRERYRRHKRH